MPVICADCGTLTTAYTTKFHDMGSRTTCQRCEHPIHSDKRGSLRPVVYFENDLGHIILPGNKDEANQWQGYERKESDNLHSIDNLAKRLDEQERRMLQSQLEHDEAVFAERRAKTRSSLLNTMASSRTSEYEKDFIRQYLSVSDERKRELYSGHRRMNTYFEAREFDGNRGLVND